MFRMNMRLGSMLMVGSVLLPGLCGGCSDNSASRQVVSTEAASNKAGNEKAGNEKAAAPLNNASDITAQPQNKDDNATEPAKANVAFMQAADQIDLAEVKIGKLAEEHAASDAVKKFAERMISDHTTMNKELRDLASKQGITLQGDLDAKHQALLNQLSTLKAGDFDQTYTRDMVAGHKQAIERFEEEANNGANADVKAWAAKWLPTLREHLALAQDAVKEVNGAANSKDVQEK